MSRTVTPSTSSGGVMTIDVDGVSWPFPAIFHTELMKRKSISPALVSQIQRHFVEKLKESGFTPATLTAQKGNLQKVTMPVFESVLRTALKDRPVESDDYAEAVGVVTDATVDEYRKKFQTDADYWFGLKRKRPADPDAAKLNYTFIEDSGIGANMTSERARVFSQGERPLLYVGPAGVGKTAEVFHFSEELGWGCLRMGHDAHTEVEDILGRFVRRDDGKIAYEYGPLARAVRDGKIFIADEINALKAGPLMVYQAINEKDTDLVLTNNNGEIVKRHPNFRWVGTMNPVSYAGTNELSLAQLGRPFVFNIGYPDMVKEAKILKTNFPKLSNSTIQSLVNMASEIRARCEKDPDGMLFSVGTRDLVKVAELITGLGFGAKRAVEVCVWNVAVNLGDSAEADAIRKLVDAHFK